jgi:hypothetical protein
MDSYSILALENYVPGNIQAALTGKRAFSPEYPTRSPERKRPRRSSNRPTLRVDCTVSPRTPPKPMTYLSPLRLTLDPTLAPSASVHGSSESRQHQQYIHQPSVARGWGSYATEDPQPTWTAANFSHGPNAAFVEMCQTSIASSYSVYSCISNSQNPFRDAFETTSTGLQTLLRSQADEARENYIKATVAHYSRVKDALAMEYRAIEELLEVGTLLLGYRSA